MSEHEDMAEAMLKQSIGLAHRAKDSHTESMALNNLGNLYSYQNRPDEAAKQYRASYDLAAGANDSALSAQASSNLARTAIDSGDFDTAETLIEFRVFDLIREKGI